MQLFFVIQAESFPQWKYEGSFSISITADTSIRHPLLYYNCHSTQNLIPGDHHLWLHIAIVPRQNPQNLLQTFLLPQLIVSFDHLDAI
jgi:hypothetical protein